jgi:general secretion pathway protein I
MARPSSRRTEGFSLLEVLVALAVFALASVAMASSYLNILNSYNSAARGLQGDPDLQAARNALLKITDITLATTGDAFDTPDDPAGAPPNPGMPSPPADHSRHVAWTADIEPTTVTDLFTVALTVVVTANDGTSTTTVDSFSVLRPTWSQAADRSALREANKSIIKTLQGVQAK